MSFEDLKARAKKVGGGPPVFEFFIEQEVDDETFFYEVTVDYPGLRAMWLHAAINNESPTVLEAAFRVAESRAQLETLREIVGNEKLTHRDLASATGEDLELFRGMLKNISTTGWNILARPLEPIEETLDQDISADLVRADELKKKHPELGTLKICLALEQQETS